MEPLSIHVRTSYKVLMIVFFLFTAGVGTLILWLSALKWPKLVDTEGMTLRSGKRLLWKDLTRMQPVTVVNQYGARISGRLDLYFGKKVARIVPHSLKEGGALMNYLSKLFGKEVTAG